MKRAIAASRYLALFGVAFGLAAALTAFAWGGVKTAAVVAALAQGRLDGMAVALVHVMDALLIAAGLLIFALGLHELFVGELPLPPWLVIRDLDELKAKIAGVVILVMAVAFLERLENQSNALDILFAGAGIALVSGALWLLSRKGKA